MFATLAATQPRTANEVVGPYMCVFFAALIISLIVTPIMRKLARRYDVVDHPDQYRKAHTTPTPYLGGVAIFLGWIAGLLALFIWHPQDMAPTRLSAMIYIVMGAIIITVIGLIDDVYHISPQVKVGGQLIAAAALASMQIKAKETFLGNQLIIETVGQFNMVLGTHWSMNSNIAYILGTLVLGFFVVGGCNAVNLLDGLDGLAAGVCGIACIGFLYITVFVSLHPSDASIGIDPIPNAMRTVMCLALLGAVLGFLPYNFNPASVFMGDAGSLLLGYLCVSIIFLFVITPAMAAKCVAASLIVFALPIADTTLAIVRRKLRGQPLFSPDRQHLHHQLLAAYRRLGLGPNMAVKLTVTTLYGLAGVFAMLGGALVVYRWRYVLAMFVIIFSFIIITAYKMGRKQAQVPLSQVAGVSPDTEYTSGGNGADKPGHSPPSGSDMGKPGDAAPAAKSDDKR